MNHSMKALLLAILSSVLLWIAWPPHQLGWLSFIAFVPLLFVHEMYQQAQIGKAKFRGLIYLSLLLWNIFTTWWIWNASPGGAVAAIVLNTLLMSIVWWLFAYAARKSGHILRYLFLISFWIAYEWLHLNWEITWPWLVIGNVFANNTLLIQWYEYTGHLGGSVWVLLVNISLYHLLKKFIAKESITKNIISASLLIVVPVIISLLIPVFNNNKLHEGPAVEALIIQPNLDPYSEKFSDTGNALSTNQQLERMLQLAEEKITDKTQFVILPETALQGGMKESDLENEELIHLIRLFVIKHPGTCVVTGADSYKIFTVKETETARQLGESNRFIDFYNAAFKIDTSSNIEIYHKSRLVPGVEKLPYPFIFGGLVHLLKLDAEAGGLGTQSESSVFTHQGIKVAPLICYESVFGGYVEQFVKKDASVFFVITNDGWWGNTDGYKQHLLYGKLRCIEFRKELLQCANTGISGLINTEGTLTEKADWWTQQALQVNFHPNNSKTFYSIYGDFLGWLGAAISISILIWLLAKAAGYRNK